MTKVPSYPTAAQTPVLHIRLNPEDVMGCIDIIKQAGVNTTGMSLAMVVRLAISAFLEGARQNGTIHQRDGFEYQEMINPFVCTTQLKKLQVTASVRNTEIARVKVDMPASQIEIDSRYKDAPRQLSPEMLRKKGRLLTRALELQTKQEADLDNFTTAESSTLALIEEAIGKIDNGQDVDLSKLL
jgi:hypothetical protein